MSKTKPANDSVNIHGMDMIQSTVSNLLELVQGQNIYRAYPQFGSIFVFRVMNISIPCDINISPGRTTFYLKIEKSLSIAPTGYNSEGSWDIVEKEHESGVVLGELLWDYSLYFVDAKNNLMAGLEDMLNRTKELSPDHYEDLFDDEGEDDDFDEGDLEDGQY